MYAGNDRLRCQVQGNRLFALEVVGETYHHDSLERILLKRVDGMSMREDGSLIADIECPAILESMPDNPHDENAIAVRIDGLRIGYLSRRVANALSDQIRRFGYRIIEIQCIALIKAYMYDDGESTFSVQLDMEELLPPESVQSHRKGEQETLIVDLKSPSTSDPVEFTFVVEPINSNQDFLAVTAGDKFRFWRNPGKRYEIRVYAEPAGDPFTSRLVGRVEDRYILAISRHLDKQLEYETRGYGVSDGRWRVWCRLTPEAEIRAREEQWRAARLAHFQSELEKSYRPRKHVAVGFSSDEVLRKGTKLAIPILYLDETAINEQNIATIARASKSGQEYGLLIPPCYAMKIHQMQRANLPTILEVLKKHKGSNYYEAQILVSDAKL